MRFDLGGDPLANLLNRIYPVGIVVRFAADVDPNTAFAFGTWVEVQQGQVSVGRDTNDANFATTGQTGGSKTVVAAGTNAAPTFTGTAGQVTSAVSGGTPAGTVGVLTFTGTAGQATNAVGAGTPGGTLAWPAGVPTFAGVLGTASATTSAPKLLTGNTSTGVAPQMTPAGTVAWPAGVPTFTGAALGTHGHTFTATGTINTPAFAGSALGTHTHTLTPAGSVSAPTFTGTATSVVQPYVVHRHWTRTK